jgi:hypothetical protein
VHLVGLTIEIYAAKFFIAIANQLSLTLSEHAQSFRTFSRLPVSFKVASSLQIFLSPT